MEPYPSELGDHFANAKSPANMLIRRFAGLLNCHYNLVSTDRYRALDRRPSSRRMRAPAAITVKPARRDAKWAETVPVSQGMTVAEMPARRKMVPVSWNAITRASM